MKTLKVLLQEVVSGIKAWVNSNFAQESNTVHKTGDETVNGVKTFTGYSEFTDLIGINKASNSGLRLYNNAVNISANSGQPDMSVNDSQGFISFKSNETVYALCDFTVLPRLTYTQTRLVTRYFTNSSSYSGVGIDLTVDSSNNKSVTPTDNNQVSLGTSTYQWNNVYAKNYFYNGTAWGLDKNNTWSAEQIIEHTNSASLKLKNSNMQLGDAVPSSLKTVGSLAFTGSNNGNFGFIDLRDSTLGNTFIRILSRQRYDANGNRSNNGTNYESGLDIGVLNDKTPVVCPSFPSGSYLGTSTNKWKSFNGLNPGALSLPNGSISESIEVDITDWYIQDPDYPNDPTKQIIDDSTTHNVTSSVPGWVKITFPNVSGNYAYARKHQAGGNLSHTRIADGIASDIFPNITLIFPIESSLVTRVKAKSASVRIFPCLGNV